jgi:protein TonB
MQASIQERLISALASAIAVILLGYLFLLGMTVEMRVHAAQSMMLLNLQTPPKPPEPALHVVRPKTARTSGRASPQNLRDRAAAIVAPKSPVPPPIPPLLISAPKAGSGVASSAGASDRPGPGEGAGGQGNGSGSGGDGNGDGDGGAPPQLIKGRLKFSDMPPALRDGWTGGAVAVRYDVEANGRVGACAVTGSSGSVELDQLTCRLIQQRFRFDPSRDRDGRPVRSTIEESHSWEIDRSSDP